MNLKNNLRTLRKDKYKPEINLINKPESTANMPYQKTIQHQEVPRIK